MPKIKECDRCLLYAHNPHLVCTVHPDGVDGDSCLDFREDPQNGLIRFFGSRRVGKAEDITDVIAPTLIFSRGKNLHAFPQPCSCLSRAAPDFG